MKTKPMIITRSFRADRSIKLINAKGLFDAFAEAEMEISFWAKEV